MAITWTKENASQEAINAWIHGIGFLVSLPAGIAMILAVDRGSLLPFASTLIYVASLSTMYLFSTLSHTVKTDPWRHWCRILDQAFIYFLIAGTFTPFICTFLKGGMLAGMMSVVWLAAVAGFYSKVLSKHRINNIASLTYLLLGWVPSMVLFGYVPSDCFAWMAVGGVVYSCGVWFLQNDHRGYFHHAIWHIAVIVASASHYLAIWHYAL